MLQFRAPAILLVLACQGVSVVTALIAVHWTRPTIIQPQVKLSELRSYSAQFSRVTIGDEHMEPSRQLTLGREDPGDKWSTGYGLGVRNDAGELIAFFGQLDADTTGFWIKGKEGKRIQCYVAADKIWLRCLDKHHKVIDLITR